MRIAIAVFLLGSLLPPSTHAQHSQDIIIPLDYNVSVNVKLIEARINDQVVITRRVIEIETKLSDQVIAVTRITDGDLDGRTGWVEIRKMDLDEGVWDFTQVYRGGKSLPYVAGRTRIRYLIRKIVPSEETGLSYQLKLLPSTAPRMTKYSGLIREILSNADALTRKAKLGLPIDPNSKEVAFFNGFTPPDDWRELDIRYRHRIPVLLRK